MEHQSFISEISAALGRSSLPEAPSSIPSKYHHSSDPSGIAEEIRTDAALRSAELLAEAAEALEKTGWQVHRVADLDSAGKAVASICNAIGATSALRSGHEILLTGNIDDALRDAGVEVSDMSIKDGLSTSDERDARETHRRAVFKADVGITGGDYVIAETGTLVIHPRKTVSRLTSLAPPVHIAVMRRGQVLPSLDELFLLEHVDLASGNRHGSMNLISGPSRTGDIEATIVQGIHGPIEAHIVLVQG